MRNISMGKRYGAASAAVLAVAVAATAAGCSSSSSSSAAAAGTPAASSAGSSAAPAASAAGSTKTFVDIPGLTTDAFYITLHNGAFDAAQKLGINLKYQGTGQEGAAASVQVGIVRSVLATKPSALIISPQSVTALEPPIQQFVSAGIPVIAVDTTISNSSLLVTQITSDNAQGGALAADTIAKAHNDQGEVAIENIPPGISTTDLRVKGFEDELKKYPKMSLVAVENNQGSMTTAQAQTKALLLAHPNLVGIFGTNLEGGQGAGDGVIAAQKQGKITVIAYDAEPAEVQLLKQGVVTALIIQQPALEGQYAVQYANDYINGQKNLIPKQVLVPNVVATSANVNDPSISKFFYSSSVAAG